MAEPLVVVTGASGFLGASVTLQFLEAGFRVRGTTRSAEQGEALVKRYPQWKGRYEYVLVPDMKVKGAFTEAVKGATYVIHTASPALAALTDNVTSIEEQLLKPPIHAARDLMQTIASAGTVKAVVYTSSFATCRDYSKPETQAKTYTAQDWGPLTYEEAAALPIVSDPTKMMIPYSAGKASAEKACWDFARTASFTLTSILPTWIAGPSREPGLYTLRDLRNNTSSKTWEQIVDKTVITEPNLHQKFIHVEDCARAHVEAILQPDKQGKRYLTLAGPATVALMAKRMRVLFPQHAHRIVDAPVPADKYGADGSATERAFGFKYRTLDETLLDWGTFMFSLPEE